MATPVLPSGARIQLALDRTSLRESLTLLGTLAGRPSRVEVGTPLFLSEGAEAIRAVREAMGPGVTVVADAKICDAGERIASFAFDAGADVVTVIGAVISDKTWAGVVSAASAAGPSSRIMIDAIGWEVDDSVLARRLDTAAAAGIEVELCAHRHGEAMPAEFEQLAESLASAPALTRVVAGSISAGEARPAVDAGFDILIVGSGIQDSLDPVAAWNNFVDHLDSAVTA
ncbi:MAG: 3-hexulose-6-phosphate synthase [Glaciihabitans sp.]|nr:3-hexulose-6-phosphate synthase [Glaciihabitans sp.]